MEICFVLLRYVAYHITELNFCQLFVAIFYLALAHETFCCYTKFKRNGFVFHL